MADDIGVRENRNLRHEFCHGQNQRLVADPCAHYRQPGTLCDLLRRKGPAGLVEENPSCLLILIIMAANAIWKNPNPQFTEVSEQTVLENLRNAHLDNPRIEALYKWIETAVWRLALRQSGAARRICRNCVHFTPNPGTCDVTGPAVRVTGAQPCAIIGFEPVSDRADERKCRNCRHFAGRQGCELNKRIKVTSVSECKAPGFLRASPAMVELSEVLQAGSRVSDIDTGIALASVISTLRQEWTKAARDSMAKRKLQRMIDIVEYIGDKEPSEADVVKRFSKGWGLTEQTIRNYLREISEILRDPSSERRRLQKRPPGSNQ